VYPVKNISRRLADAVYHERDKRPMGRIALHHSYAGGSGVGGDRDHTGKQRRLDSLSAKMDSVGRRAEQARKKKFPRLGVASRRELAAEELAGGGAAQ
jgi:hypothetical protein